MTSAAPEAASPEGQCRCWQRAGMALVFVLVPALLLALALPPTKGKWAVHKQDWVGIAAGMIAVLGLIAYYVPTPLFPRRKSVWPLILFGTALLILGNYVWNKSYRAYCARHPAYHREVFREALQKTFNAPVYGRYDNAIARFNEKTRRYGFETLPGVALSVAVAAAWAMWIRRRPMERKWDAKSLALLMGFSAALILALALCEPWPSRFSLEISGYSEFAKDLHRFKGIRDTLRHYVERMPTLQWYGQHYPPGNLILLEIEHALGVGGLTKAIVILCNVLTLLPLRGLAHELELDRRTVSATLLTFSATTGVLIYCTINTTSLLMLPGTMCLWLLVRGIRTGSIPAAAGLGLCYAVYLCFSFSASILGVLMALTVLIGLAVGAANFRHALITAAVSAVALLGVIGALALVTKFNLIKCFIAAVHGHHEQQGNGGFDDPARWLIRSTGNVLAYLISTVPLCILAAARAVDLRSLRERTTLAQPLCMAVAITIVVAGFAGLFYVETERIWIFLTPVVALAAGYELARRSEQDEPGLVYHVFLLVLLISCTQEFLFMHYR